MAMRREVKLGLMAAGGVVFVCALLVPFLVLHRGGAHPSPAKGLVRYGQVQGKAYEVKNDGRLMTIGGHPSLLLSAGLHYPRMSVGEWDTALDLVREAGFNVITTYVFWNLHEPVEGGKWDLEDNKDFLNFIKLAGDKDLFIHIRVGPYVCAEWNLGGLPAWLRKKKGMEFRSMSESWRKAMSTYLDKVMKKLEPALARNGGPIIMAQIENEYQHGSNIPAPEAKQYVDWCASETVRLNSGIPWTMCKQDDAPKGIIPTCNDYDCSPWMKDNCHKTNTPCMWTEHWTGWFRKWGQPQPEIPLDDMAYSDAKWFAAGGIHRNFYQFYGGSNFARNAAYQITQSYDYGAPVNEFALKRQPRFSHVAEFQKHITAFSGDLIAVKRAKPQVPTGPKKHAEKVLMYLWGDTLAFFVNEHEDKTLEAEFEFDAETFHVRGKSVIMFDRKQKKILHNTAHPATSSSSSKKNDDTCKVIETTGETIQVTHFDALQDPSLTLLKANDPSLFTPTGPPVYYKKPQRPSTIHDDRTDYLWYIHRMTPKDPSAATKGATLKSTNTQASNDTTSGATVASGAPDYTCKLEFELYKGFVQVYVDGKKVADVEDHWKSNPVTINGMLCPKKTLAFMFISLGEVNIGNMNLLNGSGGVREVVLDNAPLTKWWHYKGLKMLGDQDIPNKHMLQEKHDDSSSPSYKWTKAETVDAFQPSNLPTQRPLWKDSPLIWFKTKLDFASSPNKSARYFLTLWNAQGQEGLQKGNVYFNEHHIGRYWNATINPTLSRPAQQVWSKEGITGGDLRRQDTYHIPADWVKSTGNEVVIIEHIGGVPNEIALHSIEETEHKVNQMESTTVKHLRASTTTSTVTADATTASAEGETTTAGPTSSTTVDATSPSTTTAASSPSTSSNVTTAEVSTSSTTESGVSDTTSTTSPPTTEATTSTSSATSGKPPATTSSSTTTVVKTTPTKTTPATSTTSTTSTTPSSVASTTTIAATEASTTPSSVASTTTIAATEASTTPSAPTTTTSTTTSSLPTTTTTTTSPTTTTTPPPPTSSAANQNDASSIQL